MGHHAHPSRPVQLGCSRPGLGHYQIPQEGLRWKLLAKAAAAGLVARGGLKDVTTCIGIMTCDVNSVDDD